GMPSSMMPLQLLSMLSQTSGSGLLLHMLKPPPGAQVPGGTGALGAQTSMPTQLAGEGRPQGIEAIPSSGMPLQLLSQPSQISAVGMHMLGQTAPSSIR